MKPRLLAYTVIAAGVAAAIHLVTRRERTAEPAPARDPKAVKPDAPASEAIDHEWACECGKTYRFTGSGRHRVYWPSDATVSDPVLDNQCIECERPFPMTDTAA